MKNVTNTAKIVIVSSAVAVAVFFGCTRGIVNVHAQVGAVDPCVAKIGTGFVAWGPAPVIGGVVVPFVCVDANGNLTPVKPMFLTKAFSQSRVVMASAVGAAHKGDGITVVPDAATRTVTLDMADAGMQAIGVVAMYTIKDEAGTATAHHITIQPASGAIDGQASIQIASNRGSVELYCTSANCSIHAIFGATIPAANTGF